ncbi:uncharacterized protein LOC143859398 [Tasmannia lanceolata]|uniref:uncharacterized protein LOC143859398 n=1 Tax=Tasmannia lanceolata TaxID=3420 RepID=UPI004064B920
MARTSAMIDLVDSDDGGDRDEVFLDLNATPLPTGSLSRAEGSVESDVAEASTTFLPGQAVEADSMAPDLDVFDVILLQPTNNTVRVAGKFKPKAKSRPKNEQSVTTHSVPSDAAKFEFSSRNSSSTMPCTTAATHTSHSDLQKDLGGKSGTDVDMVSFSGLCHQVVCFSST